VLVLAGNAPAATLQWDKGGVGNLWNEPVNWDPNGVPTAADTAQINIPDANCLIDSSVTAECMVLDVGYNKGPCYLNMTGGTLTMSGNLQIGRMADSNGVFIMSGGTLTSTNGRLWVGYNSSGTLIMTGGEMNIYNKIEIGRNANGNGVIYMQGGTMTFSGEPTGTDLEIGNYGRGTVYMTGGVLNVQDQIKLTMLNTTGVARLYLYGGTINASNLRDPAQIFGDPLMDIKEGTLFLTGDDRTLVNDYINRGWIVAYDGLGIVDVNYAPDPNRTTVTGKRLDPELAWDPTPANRATVQRTVTLGWKPGIYAAFHNLYFGTDFNDVNDANNVPGLWPEFKGNQNILTYNPGPLDFNQTYYWRVDEVNDLAPNSPWRGVVFRFTVYNYVVVDDFESYNDIPSGDPNSHLIYKTWSDGFDNPSVNGSTIGYLSGSTLEPRTVHGGGKQSVPIIYNNTAANYSEVTVKIDDLGLSRNWAGDNFKVLSLWFYGDTTNSATERMYVELNGARVAYPGDLQQITWKEWPINLSAFVGINLSDVTELGIGFEKTDAMGGRGTVLIDDIKLRLQ
jgi:hypothetical protein